MTVTSIQVLPNVQDYEKYRRHFSWKHEGLHPDPDWGFNIGFLASDRFARGHHQLHTALRCIGKDRTFHNYSYADISTLSSQFANVLKFLGVREGEVVSTLLGRVPQLYITALGTLKKLAVYCPLFSVFGPEPIFQRLSRGKIAVLVTSTETYNKKISLLLPKLPDLRYVLLTDAEKHINEKILSFNQLMMQQSDNCKPVYTLPETPALLHFTSGTTGMPKGAVHVHKAALMHYVTGKTVLDFHPQDVFWCTADPGWVTGTSYGIIAPLVNGITCITDEEEFDADRWYSILEEHKVNIWYTSPTAVRRLMRMNIDPRKKYRLQALRHIYSVGEPLHAEEVLWGEKNLGLPIMDNWWQTETGGIMIANFPCVKIKPGSMGKPVPGAKAAIAEITGDNFKIIEQPGISGQLVLEKGWPSMFQTYLNDEEKYKKCFHERWYITGDLAKKDEEGYYWFVGRADDMIKTSGHLVGPFEVESVLMEHPNVSEAAVIGKPDQMIGEMVKAFIVLKDKNSSSEEMRSQILAFARKKLGPAVSPKEISFIDELPKTKSGKILRRLLKARELGLPEGDLSTLEKN